MDATKMALISSMKDDHGGNVTSNDIAESLALLDQVYGTGAGGIPTRGRMAFGSKGDGKTDSTNQDSDDDSSSSAAIFIPNESTDGASGLQNPITYCYLNSVVQCLLKLSRTRP